MTDTDAAAEAPSSARPGMLIGYARWSTVAQDTDIQRAARTGYGVPDDRVYVDERFTGTSTSRPGLDQARAAGDTLIVPRLDRFARSVPDARSFSDLIISRGACLQGRRGREAAGQTSCVAADEVWQRPGLTR